MKKKFISNKLSLLIITLVFTLLGCNTIKNIANLSKLQFKLGRAENFTVSSVNLSRISSVNDLSVADGIALANLFTNKRFPVSFTLNVIAHNPNAKKNNSQSNISNFDAVISNLDWTLLIDNKETINGRVANPINVPSGNQNTVIPISIGLDMFKFFSNKNYKDLINLAFAIGGVNGSSSNLKLRIKPTVSIAGFPISYPSYITVVDNQFN